MRSILSRLICYVFAFICLAVLSGAALAAESTTKQKDVVLERIRSITSDNPDFRINLSPLKNTYGIGETVAFKFSVNRDAYVTLLDFGTSGKVHVIFPNQWDKSNKVVKDGSYIVPASNSNFVFRVKGPEGVNYLKAIGTLEPFEFFPRESLVKGAGPFLELKEPEKNMKDLSVELAGKPKTNWTEAETNFTIVSDVGRVDSQTSSSASPTGVAAAGPIAKLWTEKKSYRMGEPITFYFYSEKDCYLNLIDYGSSGKARIVFPNRFQPDNRIMGGKVVALPGVQDKEYLFKVIGPPGTEMVEAVASLQKCQLYPREYDFKKHVYQPWEGKGADIEKHMDARLGEMPQSVYVKVRTSFEVLP